MQDTKRCPVCKGTGEELSRFEFNEFTECSECWGEGVL